MNGIIRDFSGEEEGISVTQRDKRRELRDNNHVIKRRIIGEGKNLKKLQMCWI